MKITYQRALQRAATQPAAAPGAAGTGKFADMRAQTAAQRGLMEMARNGPGTAQHKALSAAINQSPLVVKQYALASAASGRAAAVAAAQPRAAGSNANNTGLPDALKSGIEAMSGISMDRVKVHYNSSKPAQLSALAFAQGSDIHVSPGQEQHLPHEAWHLVQQAQGRVPPTGKIPNGAPVNTDPGLEHEADVMGPRALQHRAAPADQQRQAGEQLKAPAADAALPVQRKTNVADHAVIRNAATSVVSLTSADALAKLGDRISFHADPASYLARANQFVAFRDNAQQILSDFGPVFDFSAQNAFTNYHGTELDGTFATLQQHIAEITAVRAANTPAEVEARKTAMLGLVAKPALLATALDAHGQKFRSAKTLVDATAALADWEDRYFRLDRAAIIAAAKTHVAQNGKLAGATLWRLSPDVGGKHTHMTVYNRDIGPLATYHVVAATTRGDSDTLANHVLADGSLQKGVHLTMEVNPGIGVNNPRVFGNPPNTARYAHSVLLPAGVTWANFVGPFNTALTAVRGHVWTVVDAKLQDRP